MAWTRKGVRNTNYGRKRQYKKYNRYRTKYKGVYRKRVAAEVKRVLNGRTGGYVGLEKKFFDSSAGANAIVATTDASGGEEDPFGQNCLNCPAQGDGESERDGRQIAMDSINIKGVVSIAAQADQTAGDVVPDVFIALVMDKQTNGTQMNSEDCFANPGGDAFLAAQPFRNLEYQQRFTVLKTVHISSQRIAGAIQPVYDGTNIEQQGVTVPWSMYVKLNGKKVNFISGQTSSVVAAIADNSLHVIAYASSTSMNPAITYASRLRFMG